MPRHVMLPKDLTIAEIEKMDRVSKSKSARKWLCALRLAIENNYTAREIAAKVGMSRAWFFQRKALLKKGGDLEQSCRTSHGGGATPLPEHIASEITRKLQAGHTASEISSWLLEKRNISLSISGVYYYRQKARNKL